MSLLDMNLTKNYFRFRQDFYLQQQGTSMGSPVAPSLANMFMSMKEKQRFKSINYSDKIKKWLRFVEDVFLLRAGIKSELSDFV